MEARPGDAEAGSRPGVWDPDKDRWELYYLPDDFSQAHDLAAEHPEKLAELKELFWEEADDVPRDARCWAASPSFFGIAAAAVGADDSSPTTATCRTSPRA